MSESRSMFQRHTSVRTGKGRGRNATIPARRERLASIPAAVCICGGACGQAARGRWKSPSAENPRSAPQRFWWLMKRRASQARTAKTPKKMTR